MKTGLWQKLHDHIPNKGNIRLPQVHVGGRPVKTGLWKKLQERLATARQKDAASKEARERAAEMARQVQVRSCHRSSSAVPPSFPPNEADTLVKPRVWVLFCGPSKWRKR